MQLAFNPQGLFSLFSLLIALLLMARAWRYRSRPIVKTFLVAMSALAWWSLAAVLERASPGLSAKVLYVKMSYLGIGALPAAWLAFTLQYADREKRLTQRNVAMLAVLPFVTLAIAWTNDFHHLMWTNMWLDTSFSPPEIAVTHNTWFWVQALYAYSLLLAGSLTLLSVFLRSSSIYRKQVGTMLLAAAAPWVANFLFIARVGPFAEVDATPLAFAVTGAAILWGLSRFQLLDIMPIAHEAIFRNMVDGVIVLDTQNRIIELNIAAQRIVNRKREDAIGQPCGLLLPGQVCMPELKAGTAETQAMMSLGEGQTLRHYGVHISPISTKQLLGGHLVVLRDDSERLRAEERLRESEEKYRALFQDSRDAVYITSREGAFVDANQAALDLFGYTRDELIGLDILKLYANPADRRWFRQEIEQQGFVRDHVIRFRKKDGTEVDCLVTSTLRRGRDGAIMGYQGIMRDITQERLYHEVVRERATLQAIQASMAEGLVVFGPDSRVMYCNDVARAFLNPADHSSCRDASGRRAEEVFSPDRIALEPREAVRELLHFAGTPPDTPVSRTVTVAQPRHIELQITAFPITLEGGVRLAGFLMRDITHEREVERRRDAFISTASHELRTPMTSIMGFSELLLNRQVPETTRLGWAEYIHRGSRRLAGILDDMLSVSCIQAGKVALTLDVLGLASVVQEVIPYIQPTTDKHDIVVDIPSDLPRVIADRDKLGQVLTNLLGNAVKYSPQGGQITVSAKPDLDRGRVVVTVADQGIGIAPEDQNRLFTTFHRIQRPETMSARGTGLGLFIVKSLVELMDGEVWVESELHRGSTFLFSLPSVNGHSGQEGAAG